MFKHLSSQQWYYHIEAYKKAGYSNPYIAKELGTHPSTIGRELRRNTTPVDKSCEVNLAHEMAILCKSANFSVAGSNLFREILP